ncbi:hypothetical protein CL629_01090 [bacterium]|nr:hypothetical protein [bacterium]
MENLSFEFLKTTGLELLSTYGWKIFWILVLFFVGRIVLTLVIHRIVRFASDGDNSTTTAVEKRANTLGHVLRTVGNVVIYIIILLMILDLFGVDIRPVLAGAGVLGLAIGFGAQTLVKDFVSGLFIILENQYGVGDRVKIGSDEGNVVKVSMRSTVLKDDDGGMHYFSNSLVKNVANLSRVKKKEEAA